MFATATRFPEADDVVVDWPHRYLAAELEVGRIDARTVVAVLTHDPKFDVPLLAAALRMTKAACVGAMGSRRTHDGLDLARAPRRRSRSRSRAEVIAGRGVGQARP